MAFAGMMLISACSVLFAAVSPDIITQTDAAIENLRKRNCTVTITKDGVPLSNTAVLIKQINNDFGFGGCIATIGFKGANGDSVKYSEAIRKYFDWATPENEMKWTTTDGADDYTDFGPGDYIVDWCNENGVKVRGHNLFWNEDVRWLPSWTYELSPEQLRSAMALHIDSMMTHYRGKVAHWDIINELIHYPQATHGTPEVTLFDSATADPDIFKWILSRARKNDSLSKFVVNEYAIVEGQDQQATTIDIFIDKMNRLLTDTSSFDITGLEGHFGAEVNREKYLANIQRISEGIPRKIWLTEVDFSIPVEERADRTEELMRDCFANPNVGGLILWVWWNGNRWLESLTSVLVDSNFVETDMGERWRTLRDQWKTNVNGATDAAAQVSFRGFQGEYLAMYNDGTNNYSARFHLAPGTGDTAMTISVIDTVLSPSDGVVRRNGGRNMRSWFTCNGQRIGIDASAMREPLFMYTYSVDGRLLSKVPFAIENRTISLPKMVSSGCHIVRIGTNDKTVYSGRFFDVK